MKLVATRLWRRFVVGALGAVIGGAASFLFQLIWQIPCRDIVVTGPSCPPFTVKAWGLALGAAIGLIAAVSIHRVVFMRSQRHDQTDDIC